MVYRLHLCILYIFILICVKRFSCSVVSKVKVPLLSALVSLPCWCNIRCICLLELQIRTYWESYLWITVEIYLIKLVIETLQQFAKFYWWFCTGKWWLGDLKILIFIELISAKNILWFFVGVNASGCMVLLCSFFFFNNFFFLFH